MMTLIKRRDFLKAAGLAAFAAPLLQACGGGSPAAAPAAAPTSAGAAPTTSGGTAATTAPTTNAVATPAAANTGAKVNLSIAVWTDPVRKWQKQYAQKYAQQHPEVNLKIDEVAYGDMATKQLTELATGTLQDVVYSGVKWMSFSAYKGAFRAIDDYVKQNDPGMSDFFKYGLVGCSFDGKLYALPFEVNTGNSNIIVYNEDLLAKKGITPPTDSWTVDDFAQLAQKATDPAAHVFGTDYFLGSYYDYDTLARSFGGEILTNQSKTFALTTDPNSVKAGTWFTDLRTKYKAAPSRAQSKGIAFPAGQLATSATGIYSIIGLKQSIGTKFKWGSVLGPTATNGMRGYDSFVTMFQIYAKSKQPEQAYNLLTFMTAKPTALYAFTQQGQPPARQSVWQSPEAKAIDTIFERTAAWMLDPKDQGPFPMPYNLRFTELENKWENISPAIWYGETPFQAGLQKLQDECQKIVALGRP